MASKQASSILASLGVTIIEDFIEQVLESKQGDKILGGRGVIKTVTDGKFVVEFANIVGKKRTLTLDSELPSKTKKPMGQK